MASSVIHMCIAKEINKKLKIQNENMLLLGSIAPDISKHINETKTKSHFLKKDNTIDISHFLNKYKKNLKHPFIIGYFIHLYTDYLWDKYFMSDIVNKGTITLLDGTKIENSKELYQKLIYNDYTNLNIQLLDIYNIDLSLFYEKINIPDIKMDEIPIDKLPILIDYTGVIIANTKVQKAYTFRIDSVISFIKIASHLIYLAILES